MTMRMMVDDAQGDGGDPFSMGSPGVDEIRWLKPVHPGDTLTCETEVLETNTPRSRPGIGFVKYRITTFNQHGEPVMRMIATNIQPRIGQAADK
jgi:acyl dehydratase